MDSDKSVTILMVYASGIQKMLRVTLGALLRHEAGMPYSLRIIVDKKDSEALREIRELAPCVDIKSYQVGETKSASGQHGRLLDRAVLDVKTSHLLAMDSDCFPVADGWLKKLMDMQGDDVAASGILWPWIPPPDTVGRNTLEWRIRKYQNWNNIHPACELVRTKLMLDRGWMFSDKDGDDTNHGFMEKAQAAGLKIVGLMPTRGPLTDNSDFDPEHNRMESLIFGDMIYHHVGATREGRGHSVGKAEFFTKSRERVYNERGAEWMLLHGNSHSFKFDREEEVAQVKMKMTYETMRIFLQKNDCLFSKEWA